MITLFEMLIFGIGTLFVLMQLAEGVFKLMKW